MEMKTYHAYDGTGNFRTFRARDAAHAYELAQSMKHAPVRIDEVETKPAKAKRKGEKRK